MYRESLTPPVFPMWSSALISLRGSKSPVKSKLQVSLADRFSGLRCLCISKDICLLEATSHIWLSTWEPRILARLVVEPGVIVPPRTWNPEAPIACCAWVQAMFFTFRAQQSCLARGGWQIFTPRAPQIAGHVASHYSLPTSSKHQPWES